MRFLPTRLDPELRADTEQMLADNARTLDEAALTRLTAEIRRRYPADDNDPEADATRRSFTLAPDRDGRWRPRGFINDEAHAVITAALDTHATPRPADTFGTKDTRDPARRLACDASIIPIVPGTHSEPPDIGRAHRTFPTAIRRAITAPDLGCARPGCDRPAT